MVFHGNIESAALHEHKARPVILAVDDEPFILNSLRRELKGENYELITANSGMEGLEALERCAQSGQLPFVVISDFKMPRMDGVEFLEQVKRRWPKLQRVLLTAYASTTLLEDAINRGEVNRFLNKPWDRHQLKSVLISACEQHTLQMENEILLQERAEQNERLEAQNSRLKELNEQLRGWNENLEELVDARARQLNFAKQELATTFDAIGDPVVLIDGDFVIQRANRALAEHSRLPVTQLKGRRCHELVAGSESACEGCPVQVARVTRQTAHSQIGLAWRDVRFAVSAFPCATPDKAGGDGDRFVCTYRDITDEERRRRQLLQSQKMAALGEMAGAVAHEINNPLGGILAFAQIMLREVPEHDEKHQFLECIEDSAKRCRATVQNLLNYARFSPHEERQLVNMPTIVDKTTRIFSHKLSLHNIDLEIIEASEGLHQAWLHVNSNEVQGVLLNLLHNAIDAMDDEGGRVRITQRIDETVEPSVVVLQVADEGCGISEEHLQKIFNPFFTTKEEGKGTGLGLSISYQIVMDNDGAIDVESVVGEGTSFTVSFPIAEDQR